MGNMDLAKKMIDAASINGADIVKFQTWDVKRLKPGDWDNDGRRKIYEKAQLTLDDHIILKNHAKSLDVGFMSSVFSEEDLKFYQKISSRFLKIPSFEFTNKRLLKKVFNKSDSLKFKNVILSSGTCKLSEIKEIIDYINLNITNGQNVSILHCVSSYPCNYEYANLNKINRLKDYVNKTNSRITIGYSDHCPGILMSKVSLEFNPVYIEKHFTVDNNLPGRDNKFAILPNNLKELRNYIDTRYTMLKINEPDYLDIEIESREKYPARFAKTEICHA